MIDFILQTMSDFGFGNFSDFLVHALISLGLGSTLVFALSSWLGNVWAKRLMAKEVANHNKELARLRSSLHIEANNSTESFKVKIELYREVAGPLIEFVNKIQSEREISEIDIGNFDKSRLKTTALLGVFAPIDVFNEYNRLIDYIYDCNDGVETWDFSAFRKQALVLITLVRRDIGLYKDELSYNGSR